MSRPICPACRSTDIASTLPRDCNQYVCRACCVHFGLKRRGSRESVDAEGYGLDVFVRSDALGIDVARFGPRALDQSTSTYQVVPCATLRAEFWGVERWDIESGSWEWVGDAHDQDSAQTFARLIASTYGEHKP